MNKIKTSILFIIFFSVVSFLSAQKYSTVKIIPPSTKTEMARLLGLLEIDHFDIHDGGIIVEINQQQVNELKHSGYQYQVLVEDISEKTQALNRDYFNATSSQRAALEQSGTTVGNLINIPSAFQVQASLGGFYSFSQMNTAMNNLVAAYPSIAQKFSLGLSTEGRNIWCIKISDNVSTDENNEPELLYIGLQHAREAIGGSSMIFFMQWLCENYLSDTRIQSLINNREIYIIPCMNPDGWEYNRVQDPNGGGGWRKNRRNNGDGTFGVDLNRNWGVDWANCAGAGSSCGSANTSSDTYWGPSAFSEQETNAIRNFTLTHHLVTCIDQHSFGPYYSLPFGRPSLHPGADTLTDQQQEFYSYLSAMMGKYNGMRAGNSIQSVGYEVAGGVKDWMLKGDLGSGSKDIVYGLTGEGGAGGGTGGTYGSFWPPASQIVNLCKGIVYQDLQLALAAGSYVDISDQSDIEVNSTSGAFDFKLKRIGLEDGAITVSMIPIENINSVGPPQTLSGISNYFDVYNGDLNFSLAPGIQSGDRIRYAWRVQTGGQVYDDTVTKFYNPTVLFYDNMEGSVASNWIVSANWNYSNSYSFAGSKSLTESPGGLYGANRNDNIRYNGTFDLGDATNAYLYFWVRHRAENFCDKLQVQVSTNGSTWTAIPGRTTVQEPGTLDGSTINGAPSLTGIQEDWTPELFDLSAYLGQTTLRLRFVFTSDANTTGYDFQVDEGFNIDELKLVKTTNPNNPLPVYAIDLSGALKKNNTIDLNWNVIADQSPIKFLIEKSTDGASFNSIGQCTDQFRFTDRFPATGNNFYRIKATDPNGKSVYSKQVNIVYNNEPSITIYPNPVNDELNIRINKSNNGEMNVQVTDIRGQVLYTAKPDVQRGNEMKINVAGWTPQLYLVTITNSKSEILEMRKFFKQ